MRRVEVAAGTLCDTSGCELFPTGFFATRVLPRYGCAGVFIPRVNLDVVGEDAARNPGSG
jgi:hypothetical protein